MFILFSVATTGRALVECDSAAGVRNERSVSKTIHREEFMHDASIPDRHGFDIADRDPCGRRR
jgi:hypothetical protein